MAFEKDQEKTKEIAEKGRRAGLTVRQLKKRIKQVVNSGDIELLQKEILQNWTELLDDPDKQVRAFATKEISKFIFAQKKEGTKFPVININVKFEGIKDGKKS